MGIALEPEMAWTDLFQIVEKICLAKGGYFIFKIDGERETNRYTFAINIPRPLDIIIRRDCEDLENGMLYMIESLANENLEM